ncbi:SDR family NAD(P)-dependent oxidoreductase [Aureibacter tunicatorum]|uniref:NAD(P)-dependent dehydrogenase (Short-subunit alcohol dehydrogenase family) n=1 Tax=Aureibacter tunicatorum TaxID=866807 RepID=A0AAE3XPZ4_9BACT|nr:SDR family oxidoreductase [Aureibacter tunicatorum]MDR6240442.1 NAD(P)-dependent dehydrogenase (short-subunit alcohol dehydrogenase family) [Aureibacter tunicatorum]BDD05679.1 ketoreductase [Aureibacter tunicatorum]
MKDKTIIITGGSNGIGREAAFDFATLGANVLITGRDNSRLEEVSRLHSNIEHLVADGKDPNSAKLIVEKAISLWGKIDVLVNNVGAGLTSKLEDVTAEQVANVFTVNIVGTSLLTKLSIPYLRKSKGTVINISSAVSSKAIPGISHYGASKAALDYLTKTWALELAPDIRVNSIAPGPTKSGALTGMMGLSKEDAKKVEEQEASSNPLKRRGIPSDISRWIVWLASPETSWTTGQVIAVDGGYGIN